MNSLLPNSELKNVGKNTRPLRYDLSQIPYDYTVEVKNRFKGLDLIECPQNYGQRFGTLYKREGLRPSQRKRNAKMQNGCLRRSCIWLRKEEKLMQRRKGTIFPFECKVPKNSKER